MPTCFNQRYCNLSFHGENDVCHHTYKLETSGHAKVLYTACNVKYKDFNLFSFNLNWYLKIASFFFLARKISLDKNKKIRRYWFLFLHWLNQILQKLILSRNNIFKWKLLKISIRRFFLPPARFWKRREVLFWVPSPYPPSPRMFCLISRLLLKLAFWNLACAIYAKTILLKCF